MFLTMRMLTWALSLCLTLNATGAGARERGGQHTSVPVGRCSWVEGSVNLTADAGLVLWRAGGGTLLVRNSKGGQDIPAAMLRIFQNDLHAKVSGRFEVCPAGGFDKRRDAAVVYIASTENIRVEPSR
jgi:hypothetical protein